METIWCCFINSITNIELEEIKCEKKVMKVLNFLQEFSIPIITGVVIALIWVDLSPESYRYFVHNKILGNLTLHFFANDIFLVLFLLLLQWKLPKVC